MIKDLYLAGGYCHLPLELFRYGREARPETDKD